MLHCFSPFISLLQLPCAASKSKNKRSPAVSSAAVASAPSCSNPVLDDVADADEEDLPFIHSSNPVSIMLFLFHFYFRQIECCNLKSMCQLFCGKVALFYTIYFFVAASKRLEEQEKDNSCSAFITLFPQQSSGWSAPRRGGPSIHPFFQPCKYNAFCFTFILGKLNFEI